MGTSFLRTAQWGLARQSTGLEWALEKGLQGLDLVKGHHVEVSYLLDFFCPYPLPEWATQMPV